MLGERLEEVAEHRGIGRDLVRVAPAGDELRLLVEGGIDEIGDTGELGAEGRALALVGQVEGEEARAEGLGRRTPGDDQHLAIRH